MQEKIEQLVQARNLHSKCVAKQLWKAASILAYVNLISCVRLLMQNLSGSFSYPEPVMVNVFLHMDSSI